MEPPPPPPQDTLPEVRPDTVPADTVPTDTVRPAPAFPLLPEPDSAGWWRGVWTWDREELLREQGTSLLELLVRVPGVVVTRAGGFGQPAGVAPYGLGGGRTRVFLDGWELDPLSSATLDLQQIALMDLEAVRVERRLNELRIELVPFRLSESRPFSQIEAATGDPEVRFLRGLYAQTLGSRQVLTLGFGTMDADFPREPSFGVSSGFVRWSYAFRPDAGVQVELRQREVERLGDLPEAGEWRTLVARGRGSPLPGLHLSAVAGRAWRAPEAEADLLDDLRVDQLGARALYARGAGWIEGDARLRRPADGAFAAPRTDLSLRGGVRPLPWVELEGGARLSRTGEVSGTELTAGARVGSRRGLSAFASLAVGDRGVGLLRGDTVVPLPPDTAGVIPEDTLLLFDVVSTAVAGARAGVEWSRPGAVVGLAGVRLDPDRIAPFGLPLDVGLPPVEAEAATGVEAYLSTPVLRPWWRLRGWYTLWTETGGQPYLPEQEGRLALEFHRLYYTGNLEPTFRAEVVHRTTALVPVPGEDRFEPVLEDSSPYTLVNLYLQVRVIDLRAFLLFENVFDVRTAADVPGRPFPGARVLYGVRWHFLN